MKTYARVERGMVLEIIAPMTYMSGQEIPIEERFVPEVVETLVDVTNVTPEPACWWTYDGSKFSPPA